MVSAPILALPFGDGSSVIYSDVSRKGLGCVLMQQEKMITYASRHLKLYEENYHTNDMDLEDVIFTLKTWRHYLYRETYEIYTDHKSLRYIFTQKELNLRQRRWLELVNDNDLIILYHIGKTNVVVDALNKDA